MKINHSSKKNIKSFKWFGVTFYERERLSEKPLQFEFEPVHCADIGLYVIGKYPRLKFNNTSLSEDFNWQLHAISTIRLTILNMINNAVIEIIKVENRVTYIYKSFPKIEIDFYFKISDLQVDNDWFSQLVYKTINEVNLAKYPNLRQYV